MTASWSMSVGLSKLNPQSLEELGIAFPGLDFLWFDIDGAHYDVAPTLVPGATHMWGWDDSTAIAARIERSRVVAGAVVTRNERETCVVTARPLIVWTASHVGRIPPKLAPVNMITLELPGPLELLADDRWVVKT